MWNAISLLGAPPAANLTQPVSGAESEMWATAMDLAALDATPVGREVALEPNAPEQRPDSAPTDSEADDTPSEEALLFVFAAPVALVVPPFAFTTQQVPMSSDAGVVAFFQTGATPEPNSTPAFGAAVLQARPAKAVQLGESKTDATKAAPSATVESGSPIASGSPSPVEPMHVEAGLPPMQANDTEQPFEPIVRPEAVEPMAREAVLEAAPEAKPKTAAAEPVQATVEFKETPAVDLTVERARMVEILDVAPEQEQVAEPTRVEPVVPAPDEAPELKPETEPTSRPVVAAAETAQQTGQREQQTDQQSEDRRSEALQQVRERLATLDLGRSQKVTIKLNPEELGQVVVTLKRIGQHVEASIQAENALTRDALNTGKEALASALEQRRFELTSFKVGSLRESEMFFGQHGHRGSQQDQPTRQLNPVSHPESRTTQVGGVSPRPSARFGYASKGVDLWI